MKVLFMSAIKSCAALMETIEDQWAGLLRTHILYSNHSASANYSLVCEHNAHIAINPPTHT